MAGRYARYANTNYVKDGDLVCAKVANFRDNGKARVTGMVESVEGTYVNIRPVYAVFPDRKFILGPDSEMGILTVQDEDISHLDGLEGDQ